jgi:hypothetical protein
MPSFRTRVTEQVIRIRQTPWEEELADQNVTPGGGAMTASPPSRGATGFIL